MSLRFIDALLPIALLCSVSLAAEPVIMPKAFRAVIGGLEGSTYTVELGDGALHYTEQRETSVGYGVTSSATVTPTPQQWQEFRKSIDQFAIWRWRPNYPNHGIEDGTQWRFDLECSDRAIKTEGSNDHPDHFDRYLAAVQKLLDGKTFKR